MRFLFVLLYIVILTSCDPIVVDNSQEGQFEESNYWLTIGQINSITENIFYITILYSHEGTPANIAGFQFNMQGLHQATLLSASEGASQANNFTLSTGENTIIGFSLTGSTIPNGTNGDILTKLFYEGDIIDTDLCINNVIISDSQGSEISTLLLECN